MAVTRREILERVVAIQKTMPVFKRVYDQVPRTIDETAFPVTFAYMGRGTRIRGSNNEVQETREITIVTVLRNAKQGAPGEAEAAAYSLDIQDVMYATYDARRRLYLDEDNANIGTDSLITSDTGLITFPYPRDSDKLFDAIIFTLSFQNTYKVTQEGQ